MDRYLDARSDAQKVDYFCIVLWYFDMNAFQGDWTRPQVHKGVGKACSGGTGMYFELVGA